ncbi:MAG: methyltransferase, partial [Pseudomonadota bacterium]
APKLELALFDLPAVAARAEARLEAAGLGARARVYGGSFFDDPLPEGADLLTLVRVIYDHDDAHAMAILRRARAATPPDGALLVSEPMAAPAGSESGADAYFAFYLLAMGGGRPRTQARLIEMLRAAGFSRARALRTRRPLLTRAVLARP